MLPVPDRTAWPIIRARFGAYAMDTLLVAYVLGCVHLLMEQSSIGSGLLHRWPHLLVGAPVVAALWQAVTTSLGQRAYNSAPFQAEQRATPDARWTWGALVALQAALIGLPALLAGMWWVSVFLAFGVAVMSLLMRRSLPERLTGLTVRRFRTDESEAVAPWIQRINPWVVVSILMLTLIVCLKISRFDLGALFDGAGKARNVVSQILSPDWAIAGEVTEKMIETVALALLASSLAVPFAFGLSFLGARNVMHGSTLGRIGYSLTRLVMNIMRSIEPLVWVIIFSLWVGIGPFAGTLALFIHSVAALGKLYSEAIESIDPGPVEAMRATGAKQLHVLRYGIVPQVVPPFLSFTVYRWDINVRMATILGLVGGGGIGEMLINYQQMAAWPKVGTILLFITAVVWLMDMGSSKARERLT